MTPSTKKQFNVALSDAGHDLARRLCEHHGLSQAGLIEMLLRKEARAQNLTRKGGKKR